uniref:Reverse transcriptase domain-containing protein n=1 Tax=Fagus sylvatica TaxID=28930 RepID=A0A2N9J5V1_FAGSY
MRANQPRQPPASPQTVVVEPHVLSSLTSEGWVDLAVTKLVSRAIVDAETSAFSDSQLMNKNAWLYYNVLKLSALQGRPLQSFDVNKHQVLKETKLYEIDLQLVRSLWGSSYVDWEMLPAIGTAVLLMIWNGWVPDLYGPIADGLRHGLWDELRGVHQKWGLPWFAFGDFNVVRFPSERRGCTRLSSHMMDFSDFIEESHLVDLPLGGGEYTWRSGSENISMSRIDRFLISADWEDRYPDTSQKILPRPLSDHYPILLEVGSMLRDKIPFRFENMWLKTEGFVERIQHWWSSYSFIGPPSLVLACKLKALKEDLKKWNHQEFGNVGSQWDSSSGIGESSSFGLRTSWRQKSRVQWLKEGDNNMKFFHKIANSNRRRNYMEKIEVGGTTYHSDSDIRDNVVQFYESLYTEKENWRPFVADLPFSVIEDSDRALLDSRFDREEIIQVVKDLQEDKSPGPDGFNMAFFQKCWSVVESDVLGFFEEVYEHGTFAHSLNATFVALIPKKSNASNIRDFRPISLVGSVYKILAKVLANRLKRVLGGLVSESQNAFVGGRQTPDSVLIANECLDSCLRSHLTGVVCKLDIEKAYNHVNWDCLLLLLDRMGFGFRWRTWIRTCISTVRFSIMVNGLSSGFFGSSRGLRQGDPLSLLRFLLVMEVLSQLLSRTEEASLICGFKVVWNPILENIERKLAGWKKLYLSKGGHLILLKSTLSILPTYFLSLFTIPKHVAERIEKLQRNFLWGGLGDGFKHHLVGWNTVCRPIANGGLGIGRVAVTNRDLLGKWLWRFGREENHLWRRVIVAKYELEGGGWSSLEPRGFHGCGLWKGIMLGRDHFFLHTEMVPGQGDRILFWHDSWFGMTPLKSLFPVMFSCSSDKSASLASLLSRSGEGGEGDKDCLISLLGDFNGGGLGDGGGHMEGESSKKGSFLCVDSCMGEDPHL